MENSILESINIYILAPSPNTILSPLIYPTHTSENLATLRLDWVCYLSLQTRRYLVRSHE